MEQLKVLDDGSRLETSEAQPNHGSTRQVVHTNVIA